MNKALKLMMLALTFLLITGTAWALPVAGTYVTMEDDWYVPYTMTDADGESYSSFCLEKNNFFNPGSEYYVASVGDYAVGGGEGAIDGKDLVENETKWLYAAFISGTFDELGSARAAMVQNAIWYLEGEITDGTDWDILNDYVFDDTGWIVVAVNLISKNASGIEDNQSQLVGIAPVPEPATMLLLGTGLLGLAGLGRKRIKKA